MELNSSDRYRVKVRHIVPAFLLILVGSLLGLALIRWVLSVRFDALHIREEIWTMWIPMFFPWIPITVWLRHRLKILVSENDVDRFQIRLQFLAWIVIAIPLIFSQYYFTDAVGTMVHLESVEELSSHPAARYYTIGNFDVVPALGGSAETVAARGRSDEYLDFTIYFVTPITTRATGAAATYHCWYGVKYDLEISNRLSQAEKDAQYKTFYSASLSKINHYNYHQVTYFRQLPPSDDRDGFIEAINNIDPSLPQHAVILAPFREDFEARGGTTPIWLFASAAVGILVFLFALRWQNVVD